MIKKKGFFAKVKDTLIGTEKERREKRAQKIQELKNKRAIELDNLRQKADYETDKAYYNEQIAIAKTKRNKAEKKLKASAPKLNFGMGGNTSNRTPRVIGLGMGGSSPSMGAPIIGIGQPKKAPAKRKSRKSKKKGKSITINLG